MEDEKLLTPELFAELMTFINESPDGDIEVVDMMGLVQFIARHYEQYPFLLGLVKVNGDAAIEHYKETGEVPPGIKLTEITRRDDNVVELKILRGPIPPHRED